jgi:RNA polymerase sigma-70 factor (ECF subfamily)
VPLIVHVTDDTDAGLLARSRIDPAAVELFYRRHRARVLAYAMSRCRQPADVADVVAATFLAALEKPESFDPRKGEAGAWLVGIATRQWLLLCRSERKQQQLRAEAAPAWAPSDADIIRLEEQIDAARASEPAWAALSEASPVHREVLQLVGPGGLSARDAAAVLGISTGAFRVRLLRARRALKAALAGPPRPENRRSAAPSPSQPALPEVNHARH